MQEFLTNDTVNCNLMSLTGYRTLVILQALMESPKSNDEINDYLFNNKYVKEKFSSDTLRIYINSLRHIGCQIIPANKSNNKKYELVSHPFEYEIPASQLTAILKLYKSLYNKVYIEDLINLENLFKKLASFTKNQNTKAFMENISLFKNVNMSILKDLLIHCKNKNQIILLYNSPKSGEKEIEIMPDKLSFRSEKLYLWGNNFTHDEYSFFAVDRILKICSIKIKKEAKQFPPIKVIYELYNHNNSYVLENDEKLLERYDNKLLIEVNAKNEFSLMQRILHMTNDCKIVEPIDFKTKILNKLKKMELSYANN